MNADDNWFADFYSTDLTRVLASLKRLDESSGAVTGTELWSRAPGESELRGAPHGVFSPLLFAPDSNRFGHIETSGVVHPAVFLNV